MKLWEGLKENVDVDAAKVAPIEFLLHFEEIRDHMLYAALCNCNFVEPLKMGHSESPQIFS